MENELMNEVTNLQARSSQIKAPHYESTPCLSWNLALVLWKLIISIRLTLTGILGSTKHSHKFNPFIARHFLSFLRALIDFFHHRVLSLFVMETPQLFKNLKKYHFSVLTCRERSPILTDMWNCRQDSSVLKSIATAGVDPEIPEREALYQKNSGISMKAKFN